MKQEIFVDETHVVLPLNQARVLPGNLGREPKSNEARAVPNHSAPRNYFPGHLSGWKNNSSIVRDFCAPIDRRPNTNDSIF